MKTINMLAVTLLMALVPLQAVQAQTPPPAAVSAQRLVDALTAGRLAIGQATPMTKADYGKAPFVCKGLRFVVPASQPTAYGRAFYCPRKADGDRLEQYYVNVAVGAPPYSPHVLAQRPFLLVLDGTLPAETVEKYRAALPIAATGNAVTPAAAPSQISVAVEQLSYMKWGRPQFMIDPSRSCTTTDDSHAVLMLKASVAITNNSATQTMSVGSWRGRFYRADGSPATTCFFAASGRQTKERLKNDWDRAAATKTALDTIESREFFSIPPGGTLSLTYAVFVELNERVAYGEITDAVLGTSNRIEVPGTVPVP